jgi:hypothetical protein
VDDVENRKALVARFELSQSIYQKDPWAELAQPEEARQSVGPGFSEQEGQGQGQGEGREV